MKTLVFFLALFCCSSVLSGQPTAQHFNTLSWLEGTWKRTNAKPGRSGIEQWKKISDTEWHGQGVNLKGTDTTFVEKMKLITKDGNIFFVADVPENKGEVYFKLTELSEKSFTCENAQHDFPKKIIYERNGNAVKAIISGYGKAMEYLFERIE